MELSIIYPENTFKNKVIFDFDFDLFNKILGNSDEFWKVASLWWKILRQSSKIYDYTQYIILKEEQIINKERNFKNNLNKFLEYFPEFKKIVEMRQKKF